MRSLLKTVVLLGVLAGSTLPACTIPVFRYALDRWEADPFHLIVPIAWARQPENAAVMSLLRAEAVANLELKEKTDAAAPTPQLFFPRDLEHSLWPGTWDQTTVRSMLESPARRALAERILSGESVVWVMIDSGKADDDKATAERVEKRLRYLEQAAGLPPQDPNDPDSQLGPGPPLKLKFSLLRVARDKAEELPFCHMLAGPEGGKLLQGGETLLAPVFGRGRVLGAWKADEMDDTAIEDACLFLAGRCSCRVKNQSPGWDVLMRLDWAAALQKATPVAAGTVPPAAPAAFTFDPPSMVTTTTTGSEPGLIGVSSVVHIPWSFIVGGLFIAIGVAWLVVAGKRSAS